MTRKQRPLNLFKVVEEALAETAETHRLRRLIPLAWPVLEVEHQLKVRLEEELGVIERHLLEALARFGPLTCQGLSSLLGLEEAAVGAVIQGLERFPRVITEQAAGYAVPNDTLDRLSEGRWTREVVQPCGFLVNGPTAGLVPLVLGKAPAWHWLEVNLAEGTVEDYTGKLRKSACWVAPLHSTGQAGLVHALRAGSSEHKADVGIPEGAVEVIDASGRCQRQRWLLALAEVRDDGAVIVRPACRPDVSLLSVGPSLAEKFAEQIRRGQSSARGLLQPDASGRLAQDMPAAWSLHLAFEGRNGTLSVALHDPAKVPLWSDAREVEKPEDDWLGSEEEPRVPSAEFPALLRDVLSFPYWWHPHSFAVRRIDPSDTSTAEMLLLLAGLRKLARLASEGVDPAFDLAGWWSETQDHISATWKSDSGKARVRFDALLAAARRSPDGAVVDFISEYS